MSVQTYMIERVGSVEAVGRLNDDQIGFDIDAHEYGEGAARLRVSGLEINDARKLGEMYGKKVVVTITIAEVP